MIPTFEWGSSESFAPALPMRAWTYGVEQVGGHDVSAAGLPASFVVRDQETLTLELRVYEWEWEDCLDFLRAGMRGEEIEFTPDEDADSIEVFFVSPVFGEEPDVDRDGEYPRVLNVTVTIRAVSGDFGVTFYEEPGS